MHAVEWLVAEAAGDVFYCFVTSWVYRYKDHALALCQRAVAPDSSTRG